MTALASILRAFQRVHKTPAVAAFRLQSGHLDLEAIGEPRDSAYAWFSCTKGVTAALAADLVQAGELDWDSAWTPWFPEAPQWASSTTWRDLLGHGCGIRDPLPLGWIRGVEDGQGGQAQLWADLGPKLEGLKPSRSPRRYSNLGYVVAGEALARIGGTSFEELARIRILEPLGMTGTTFGPGGGPLAPGHLRWGSPYQVALGLAGARRAFEGRTGGFVRLRPCRMMGSAAGGLVGPPEDAVRYLEACLQGRLSFGTGADGEPLGWERSGSLFHHAGTGMGYVARLGYDPERKVAAGAFANRSGALGPTWAPLDRLFFELVRPRGAWEPARRSARSRPWP